MKLSTVHSKYGAPMGRSGLTLSRFLTEYAGHGRVSLARVPLNSGGYDPGGAYWGLMWDNPLWRASFITSDGCETIETYFRAPSRAAAKQALPGAKFFR